MISILLFKYMILRGDNKAKKLLMFGVVLILTLTVSCARSASNYETGLMKSSTIYNDLAPQIDKALKSSPSSSTRANNLKLADDNLNEYKTAYNKCIDAVTVWKSTGQAPEYTRELYIEMWESLLKAQSLAASEYIYADECAATTSLKGKSCPGG